MNNERAHNEGEHAREDERDGSLDYVDNTTAVLWVACLSPGAIVDFVCVGWVEPVAYKERIWTMPVAKKRHPIMILALRTLQIFWRFDLKQTTTRRSKMNATTIQAAVFVVELV